jgi:hypothetical protein
LTYLPWFVVTLKESLILFLPMSELTYVTKDTADCKSLNINAGERVMPSLVIAIVKLEDDSALQPLLSDAIKPPSVVAATTGVDTCVDAGGCDGADADDGDGL